VTEIGFACRFALSPRVRGRKAVRKWLAKELVVGRHGMCFSGSVLARGAGGSGRGTGCAGAQIGGKAWETQGKWASEYL
jgi:hypothetical protein